MTSIGRRYYQKCDAHGQRLDKVVPALTCGGASGRERYRTRLVLARTEVGANGMSSMGDGCDPIIAIDTCVTGGREGKR